MSYTANLGLSRSQVCHKWCLDPAKDSYSFNLIKEIDYLERNSKTIHSMARVFFITRINAVAIPILALVDTVCYTFKTIGYLILIQPEDTKYTLFSCGKSMKVFLSSIVIFIPSIISPTTIYRTEENWLQIQEKQIEKELKSFMKRAMKKNPTVCQKELFKIALEKLVKEYSLCKTTRTLLNELNQLILDELPTDPNKVVVALDGNSELFAKLMMNLYKHKVLPNENFKQLFSQIVKLKDPELKTRLTSNLSANFPKFLENIAKENENSQIPLYLIRQFSEDVTFEKDFVTVINETKYLNKPTIYRNFITTLTLIVESSITKETKETLVREFIDSIKAHKRTLQNPPSENLSTTSTLEKQIKKLTHAIASKTKLIQDKEKKIADLQQDENDPDTLLQEQNTLKEKRDNKKNAQKASTDPAEKKALGQEIRAINQRIKEIDTSLNKKKTSDHTKSINALKENISKLQEEINELQTNLEKVKSEFEGLPKNTDSTPVEVSSHTLFSHINSSIKTMNILLNLQSEEMIMEIVADLKNKKYNGLTDPAILNHLFKTVFNFKQTINTHYLQELRDPNALLKFHLKLLQYKGKHRNTLLKLSKEILIAASENTFSELRNGLDGDPHLQKIIAYDPQLKNNWDALPETETVGQLLPNTHTKFDDYKVMVTEDPTDILNIGNDTHSCVNLDGRIEKIIGLMSLLRDGKTQTIVVKQHDKGRISAETQLQLMWDSKNNRPVLILDEINFEGKVEESYPLMNAIIAFAKKRAENLGVDLVSCYENQDPSNPILGAKYKGRIVSLGSSSPIEFVNRYHRYYEGNFDYGTCYLIHTATASLKHNQNNFDIKISTPPGEASSAA